MTDDARHVLNQLIYDMVEAITDWARNQPPDSHHHLKTGTYLGDKGEIIFGITTTPSDDNETVH